MCILLYFIIFVMNKLQSEHILALISIQFFVLPMSLSTLTLSLCLFPSLAAPPHEHHVIAMHKHGHKWGGLPTVFWLTIVALIVIFHLFLIKLVINEYCGGDVKVRYR